jgi:hypothetical protein
MDFKETLCGLDSASSGHAARVRFCERGNETFSCLEVRNFLTE